jgi:hypothetical protein
MNRFKALLNVAFGITFTAAGAIAAELVVVESSSDQYTLSQVLSDDVVVELEAGTQITLISEDGLIVTLSGPFEGSLAETEGQDGPDALDALGRLLTETEVEARDIGGVRFGDEVYGDPAGGQIEDRRSDPWVLHTRLSGPHCLPKDADAAYFWRDGPGSGDRLHLSRVTTSESVVVDWGGGEDRVAWPDHFERTPGAVYLVRTDGELRSAAFLIHEVPAAVVDSDIASVAWLAAQGCISQARLVLAGLQ